MKRIRYNLASEPKVNGWAFAWRAGALAACSLLIGALAVANLARLQASERRERNAARLEAAQAERMRRETAVMRSEIEAKKRAWAGELASSNSLLRRKGVSFVRRLDLLEKVFNPGVRILQLSLVNEAPARIVMTIRAESLRELFALYKQLAPHDLLIGNEVQSQGEYQVNLSFAINDETL